MYFRRDNRLRRNSFHRLIVFFDAVYLNRLDFYMGRNTRAPPLPWTYHSKAIALTYVKFARTLKKRSN